MLVNHRTLFISRLGLIISLTIIIQIAGFPQPITGPLINAILFITTTLFGSVAGITLGCLTPLIAVIRGQLPTVLAPLVPFIALANAILVLVYYSINYKIMIQTNVIQHFQIYIAIIVSAMCKYLFLASTVKVLFPYVFNFSIPEKVAVLMMTPQLITALIGGLLFLIFFKILNKAGIWRRLK